MAQKRDDDPVRFRADPSLVRIGIRRLARFTGDPPVDFQKGAWLASLGPRKGDHIIPPVVSFVATGATPEEAVNSVLQKAHNFPGVDVDMMTAYDHPQRKQPSTDKMRGLANLDAFRTWRSHCVEDYKKEHPDCSELQLMWLSEVLTDAYSQGRRDPL